MLMQEEKIITYCRLDHFFSDVDSSRSEFAMSVVIEIGLERQRTKKNRLLSLIREKIDFALISV